MLTLYFYLVSGCSTTLLEIPLSGSKWTQPKHETKKDDNSTIFKLKDNVLEGKGYSAKESYHLQLNAAVIEEGNARTFVLVPVFVHPYEGGIGKIPILAYIKKGKSLLISIDNVEYTFASAHIGKIQSETIEGAQMMFKAYHQANYVTDLEMLQAISLSKKVEVTLLCDGITVSGTFRRQNFAAFSKFYEDTKAREANINSKAKVKEFFNASYSSDIGKVQELLRQGINLDVMGDVRAESA